jgi:hypothetical protein
MEEQAEPALIEGREHDHIIVPRRQHLTLSLHPEIPFVGRNPFFYKPRRWHSRIEQAENDTMRVRSKLNGRKSVGKHNDREASKERANAWDRNAVSIIDPGYLYFPFTQT